jgi:hypothetical protein
VAVLSLTIGYTATGFPPLRGSKPAREPGVMQKEIVMSLKCKGCSNWRPLSGNRMMCQDDERNDTWAISPMTDQQLQMYQMNKQQNKTTNTNCYRTYGGGMNCTTY